MAMLASQPTTKTRTCNWPHGDTLIVWKLDRLGRSVRDLVNILHDLISRGVQFQSLTEQIDTTHPLGKTMLHMVASLAELERGLIVERTNAGQQGARKRGVKFGAKPKLSEAQVDHARQLIDGRKKLLRKWAHC